MGDVIRIGTVWQDRSMTWWRVLVVRLAPRRVSYRKTSDGRLIHADPWKFLARYKLVRKENACPTCRRAIRRRK